MGNDRGKVAPQQTSEPTYHQQRARFMLIRVSDMVQRFLVDHAENIYDQHRLAWVYEEEDGSGTLFVCKCQEGMDRRGFNAHIRDAYAGLLESPA